MSKRPPEDHPILSEILRQLGDVLTPEEAEDVANVVFRISHDVHQKSGLRAIPSATDQCLVRLPGGLASKTSRARVFCDLQSSRRYAFLCLLTQATAARKRTTNASRGSMWTGSVTAKRARSSRRTGHPRDLQRRE